MEPQKPGNSPGPGPKVAQINRESPKSERYKESAAGQCRMRSVEGRMTAGAA